MVRYRAVGECQDLRFGFLCASVFLHAGVIALLGQLRSSLPPAPPVTPSALVGTSFEVVVDETTLIKAAEDGSAVASLPNREPAAPAPVARPETSEAVSPATAALRPIAVSTSALVQDAPRAEPRSDEADAAASRASAETSPGHVQVSSATYGQEGNESAPAQLRRAFIKMLPLAAKLDTSWLSLPAMSLGRGRFVLRLNEQGQLISVDVRGGDAHPILVRAMQKNQAFLGMRRFASLGTTSARSIVVEVSGHVSQKTPQAGAEDKVIALGVRVDPQDPQAEPRGAYFTYDSGQHVELVWNVLPEP